MTDDQQPILSEFEGRVLKMKRDGHTYAQIAAELRCPVRSVDNALARIKRRLASELKPDAGDSG